MSKRSIKRIRNAFGVNKSSLDMNAFRAEVTGRAGHAATNRYEIRINPPPGTLSLLTKHQRQIVMRAESISLPGVNLATAAESNLYGPSREIVEGVNYAETFDITFIETQHLAARMLFTDWQQLTYDVNTWNIKYYNDYIGTIDAFLLDHKDSPAYGVRIWECYPKTINALEISNTNTNVLARITVSFQFRYWTEISQFGTHEPWFVHEPEEEPGIPQSVPPEVDEEVTAVGTGDPNFDQARAAQVARDREAFRAEESRRGGFDQPTGVSGTRLKAPGGNELSLHQRESELKRWATTGAGKEKWNERFRRRSRGFR